MKAVSVLFGALVLSVAATAPADFTKHEALEFSSGKASIKVLEPKGAKVTVGTETDTVPHIFSLPDQDAFVPVRVVAADGETWNGKVEVKAHKQTTISLSQVAKPGAPAATAAAKQSFIGHVINLTQTCTREGRVDRFAIVRNGAEVKNFSLPLRHETSVELEAGDYSVRTFTGSHFVKAHKLTVSSDNWRFEVGC
jgi:hypothetical protein